MASLVLARADQLPLHTAHHRIVDAQGRRVKLAGVNWYGADNIEFSVGGLAYRPLAAIAHQVKAMGFNSVRIPWSNELVEANPLVPDYARAANPALKGKRALEVLDLTIDALAHEGLYVILDNHVSRAWSRATALSVSSSSDRMAARNSPVIPVSRYASGDRRHSSQPARERRTRRREMTRSRSMA